MFDLSLMVEARQQVQEIENKLGASEVYAAYLKVQFQYINQKVCWSGQLGLATLEAYAFDEIELKLMRYIINSIVEVKPPRLNLGYRFDGASQFELANEIRLAIWRGDRGYRIRPGKEDFV